MPASVLPLLLALQSPDGALPNVPVQAPPAVSVESPPPQNAAPPPQQRQPPVQWVNPDSIAPAPAPAAAAPPAAPAPSTTKPARDPRDFLPGAFVGGVGAAIAVGGIVLGALGLGFWVIGTLPFPGSAADRVSFTNGAMVGGVFSSLVGVALVIVGSAMVALGFFR